MDSTKSSVPQSSSKSKLARTFAKVLHIRVGTGIPLVDGIKKSKPQPKSKEEQFKNDSSQSNQSLSVNEKEVEEELRKREALEPVLAKIFASISSVKAAYAQFQCAQAPYDASEIESADKLILVELKNLSEVKRSFLKKQFDVSPEETLVSAEIQEQRSLLKTYEIMGKKLEFQAKIKGSEAASLREKLSELNRENRTIERSLNRSGPLSVPDNLHISGVNPNHFATVLRHVTRSVQSFVRLMIYEMKSADWDVDAAAEAVVGPGVVYSRPDHKCFAFESFVCREMFESFQNPNFSIRSDPSQNPSSFFNRFIKLKSLRAKEYLSRNPKSAFAKFIRFKYLRLVHPKMESDFFGNLAQRNLMNSGSFPDTTFFTMFGEMARRVWLLHCLAFSFEPEVTVFQVAKGCQFSEVYMETVAEEVPSTAVEYNPKVAFTVVPGFKIGKTVVQCQVYVSNCSNSR